MTLIDTDTKHKLREMGVGALADSFEMQDDVITVGMPFAERLKLAVDDVAHSRFGERQSTHRIARFRRPESMEPPGRRSVAALYSQ